MRIIGVTGGIGSGKSTVSRILEELGAKVIDADKVAREIVEKGSEALIELTDFFGGGILDETGELNRKKLAEIVFNHPEKLNVLNSITHKYVVERMTENIDSFRDDKSTELVVLDVPIPVKHGFMDMADEIWAVVADKEVRICRIMDRSGFSREEAVRRIHSQMSDEEYSRIADRIIYNNGGFDQLKKEVIKAYTG